MSQPTCATCRFFVLAPGNTKWGVCRRFPAIPPRNKPDPADEWCGEHSPRPDTERPMALKCSTEFPRLTVGARIIRHRGAEQAGTIVAVRDDVNIHGALLVEWEPVGGVGGRYCAWTSPFGVDRID